MQNPPAVSQFGCSLRIRVRRMEFRVSQIVRHIGSDANDFRYLTLPYWQ